jgi:hypothetical protein
MKSMARLLLMLVCTLVTGITCYAQSFEMVGLLENYKGVIGETIKVPVKVRNTTDKSVILVFHKVSGQIGTNQKNYYCIDNHCLDAKTEDFFVKLEPNQLLTTFQVALEAGLAQGSSTVKYLVFNKSNPADVFEFEMTFQIEETAEKPNIYSSDIIQLHDVYPNPAVDQATVEYTLFSGNVKAKIMIHNLLGNIIDEVPLPQSENRVKIRADALNSGVYFYTLYLDNEGVVTRKLLVRK